jgi:hypothetical protein
VKEGLKEEPKEQLQRSRQQPIKRDFNATINTNPSLDKIIASPKIKNQERIEIELVKPDFTKTLSVPDVSFEPKVIGNLEDIFSNERIDKNQVTHLNFENAIGKDYLNLAKENIQLGLLGELFVLEYERELLIKNGRNDLIEKIIHVSQIQGDYLGYDILSFNELGQIKYIEVKTSPKGYKSDFFLTRNELEKIKQLGNYYIYRIFDFQTQTKKGSLYVIDCKKDLNEFFDLEPTAYKVKPKNK